MKKMKSQIFKIKKTIFAKLNVLIERYFSIYLFNIFVNESL